MRSFTVLIVVAAIVATAGQANAAVVCGPVSHTRTVRATDTVRVYKHNHGVYACAAGQRGRVDIGISGDFTDIHKVLHVRIAGNFVAAVRWCACREYQRDGRPSLHVWDVVRRRELALYGPPSGVFPIISDVEVAADGNVAYLVPAALGSTTIEVRRNGELLDSGPVAPRSLTLGGDGRMYWRHAGALRSAPLHAVAPG